jgi:hypothetical protein
MCYERATDTCCVAGNRMILLDRLGETATICTNLTTTPFIEVKYRSGNDSQGANYLAWNTYLSALGLDWKSKAIQASGCYELARNWCLLRKLANGRSATLVNLGPSKLFLGAEGARLDRFIASLDIDERTHLQKVAWADLLGDALIDAPAWFSGFCRDRCLAV